MTPEIDKKFDVLAGELRNATTSIQGCIKEIEIRAKRMREAIEEFLKELDEDKP